MWYEILPPMLIISACVMLPAGVIAPMTFKFFTGHETYRNHKSEFEFTTIARDYYMTGNQVVQRGLEGIPDK